MTFELSKIVSWGRMHDEYVRMFNLSDIDLKKKILSCADGPSGFNCYQSQKGYSVVSIDPTYQYSSREIREQVLSVKAEVLTQLQKNLKVFVWNKFKSPEELIDARINAMEVFLKDYELGKKDGRYLSESLPKLSFMDKTFDIVLCSHFLFTYSTHLDTNFHIAAILEMLRVSSEVRVFPLLDLNGQPSIHVNDVLNELKQRNIHSEILTVPYEIQCGGNQMLRTIN
ncbi:MAG: SAM-dependent methyltransferase [Candidatus Omnitrophica bacterium]|nr:SAM-dependent methyltransferase [Candidatus Omnitrophota bacterium]